MEPKERISFKAHELFMQYGIRSVSMDDIANSIGMSKKTLYQYFSDKDELVDDVVDAHIQVMQTDCASCRKDAKDAVHEILFITERIIETYWEMGIAPWNVMKISGIGCSSKTPAYFLSQSHGWNTKAGGSGCKDLTGAGPWVRLWLLASGC